ncbi:MAG: flagellar export protein FliJ [Nitrospira sp.]
MSIRTLQHYRTQIEEQLKMELAEVTQALIQAERSCTQLVQDREAQEQRYREDTGRGLTIEQLLQWQSHFEALAAATEQARRTVAHWQAQWDEARARLVSASQDRRTLDRLIERYRHTAQRDAQRREQQSTDEAAHHRHLGQGEYSS